MLRFFTTLLAMLLATHFPLSAADTVIVDVTTECLHVQPYILDTAAKRIDPNATTMVTIEGIGFVDGVTTLTVPGFDGTVDSLTVNSAYSLDVTLTTGTTQTTYDLVLTNECVSNTPLDNNGQNLLRVETSTWTDLRAGGDAFTTGTAAGNDIRHRTGMTVSRDNDGMYFAGQSPWNSWVKFESDGLTRGSGLTTEWIFQPTTNFMIGLGSDETDESSTSQWNQGEWMAYFSSGSNWWGMYGNNGTPGTFQNQSVGASVTSGGTYKLKLENDGAAGQTITMYALTSGDEANWDDETTVVQSVTSVSSADATNLFPFIIPPNGGTTRFLAFRVQ